MENNQIKYEGRKGVHVPKDVKEYVLKRIKESGLPVRQIAEEHGLPANTVHRWLKDETGGFADHELAKLQKENQLLKQLVAELSLKVRETEKRGW